MKLNNFILFIIPAFIWGSTWFTIKFQLGTVDPLLSVGYRFTLAGLLLLIYCRIAKLKLKYSLRQHFFMALQGLSLFGINYWLVYKAELSLTSGLVAVIFSLLIFMNIFFNTILLKGKLRPSVMIGAVFGISGTILIYNKELIRFTLSDNNFLAIIFCLMAVVLASLGNIISAYNQKQKLPVVQTNAFGMTYGAIMMLLIGFVTGRNFTFEFTSSYIFSLLYLALFGSIIAFSTYLKLLGNIGPDRAAYATMIIPVIALIISSIFEDFRWNHMAIAGTILILSGNILALQKRKLMFKKG